MEGMFCCFNDVLCIVEKISCRSMAAPVPDATGPVWTVFGVRWMERALLIAGCFEV